MSLTLHMKAPGGTVIVSVDGKDTVEKLKARTAALAGLDPSLLSLVFEGQELEDSRSVTDYPFQDQSEVTVTISKKQAALNLLKELSWREPWTDTLATNMREEDATPAADRKFCSILDVMHKGGLCGNGDAMNRLLRNAAYWGFSECADLLLSRGVAGVDSDSATQATPLICACSEGRVECVRVLLAHKADPNKPDHTTGRTPLHIAVLQNNLLSMQLLLEHNALVDLRDGSKRTPLMCACSWDKEACVKLLLKHNADLNVKDGNGNTALYIAALGGAFDCEKLLLAHGK
eukprot:TRINITY_DN2961_c0_g1_i1.p1 TRINITY_DN2961_c0_g1~~TRINITY_DN2961_c0_g1_i1.p1  ORF type:complete len:303 (+),score=70.72 TRINITY_DN2961_c0_g1_i1:41-910(+)